MIDTAVLLFSLGMVAFVVVRATILDRKLPWFPPPSDPDSRTPPGQPPGTPPGAVSGAPAAPGVGRAPGPAPRRARPRRVSA